MRYLDIKIAQFSTKSPLNLRIRKKMCMNAKIPSVRVVLHRGLKAIVSDQNKVTLLMNDLFHSFFA